MRRGWLTPDTRSSEAARKGLDVLWVNTHNYYVKSNTPPVKKGCHFIGSSLKDLQRFPEDVQSDVGYALHEAQCGLEPYSAKALQGFSGRGTLEIVEDHDGNTYRSVYTVRFAEAIYVLHCFQKKSKKGITTPKHDVDLIKTRLAGAEKDYQSRYQKGAKRDE